MLEQTPNNRDLTENGNMSLIPGLPINSETAHHCRFPVPEQILCNDDTLSSLRQSQDDPVRSSKFFKIGNVALGISGDFAKKMIFIKNKQQFILDINESHWYLLSNNREFLLNNTIRNAKSNLPRNISRVVWTDDFSSLVHVFK